MSTELAIRVVDAGTTRFVDLRRIARDDFVADGMFATLARSLAELPPADHAVFVAPAVLAGVLAALSDADQLAYWPRFREPVRGATEVTVFVDGAVLPARAVHFAQQAGVVIALEWPGVTGTDTATGTPRTWRADEILGPADDPD